MTSNTQSPKNPGSGVLQIRYEKDQTRTSFLEIRAHHESHEAALVFLMDFYKKNYKPVMTGSIT
jgi:hypothetical protein